MDFIVLQVANMQKYNVKTFQPQVRSYHILKIAEILASLLLCKKKEHEFMFESSP